MHDKCAHENERTCCAEAAALVTAVKDGRLTESRLTEAFLRVERFKKVSSWATCAS